MEYWIPIVASVALVTIAVITDTKRGIIPNRLIFPAMALGLGVNVVTAGFDGAASAFAGMALGLGLMLIPFLGGMGAGDVKLMMAVGVWLGPQRILWTFVYAALLGGAVALLLVVRRRGWPALYSALSGAWGGLVTRSSDNDEPVTFPYAAAIWFGVIATTFVGGIR